MDTELIDGEGDPAVDPSNLEHIAQALVPYGEDSKKNKYLGFRACGFSVREAQTLTEISHRTIERWREADSEFRRLDTRAVGELRQTLSKSVVFAEFLRNFRLVLEKDAKVLKKSLLTPNAMSNADTRYLEKVRAMYTPQQLEAVKLALMSVRERKEAGVGNVNFNFTRFVLDLRKQGQQVEDQDIIDG